MRTLFLAFIAPLLCISIMIHHKYHMIGMDRIVDYLNVPGPLTFDSNDFYLKWTSNPINGYYKQEYLRKKDTFPDYNRMLLLEYMDNVKAKDALNKKVKELETRRSNDPVLNYEVITSPDGKQFIIDFLVSNGNTYEWNVYKFAPNQNGNLLYGFSLRSSEKGELNGYTFFSYLKKNRSDLINKMIETKVPEINIEIRSKK